MEECFDLAGHPLEGFLSCVEAREPQQIAHQPFHPVGVPGDRLQERAVLSGIRDTVEKGLDVSADGCQGCAQFMRDVGDEVAADLVRAAQVRDVVEHQDGAACLGSRDGGAPGDEGRTRGDR